MAFESVINPHNGAFGSATILGLTGVSWQALAVAPQAVLADDASVAIHGKSAHVAHSGSITLADPASAKLLAAQAGPRDFSFDASESDAATVASYSFADCEFSQPSEGMGLGQPASCTLSWSGKALTVT